MRQIARIDSFESKNTPVRFQRGVQLTVPDINGINACCSTFEQHLREAARGGTEVETATIFGRKMKPINRRDQFQRDPRPGGMSGTSCAYGALALQLRRYCD